MVRASRQAVGPEITVDPFKRIVGLCEEQYLLKTLIYHLMFTFKYAPW